MELGSWTPMTGTQQSNDIRCFKSSERIESEVESHYLSKIHIPAQKYRRMVVPVESIWFNRNGATSIYLFISWKTDIHKGFDEDGF